LVRQLAGALRAQDVTLRSTRFAMFDKDHPDRPTSLVFDGEPIREAAA
jgi:hypothetical protein